MSEPGQPLPPCPHCRAAHPEELLLCPTTNRLLPLEGRMLDRRFRFMRKLGEGGMSTVWMAENIRVRKRVAIKIMHPEYARNPRTLERFQNEATAAGRIGNPHICDILDFGESPLGPYMVMEMLRGQSFAELLEDQGRIDPPLAVLIICEALKGLIAAHAAGIIHRDLKPENVFLHEPERGRMLVKLMDFGISKFTEDPGGGRTGANVVMGTPEYMSPEQAAGAANVDARTDIWAMGVMLYRAIGGVEPFRGKTMAALLLALSTEQHPPLTSYLPGLPPGLVAVIDCCLAKDPQHRFGSAAELYTALAPYQQVVAEGERPQAPARTGKTAPPGFNGGMNGGMTGYETLGPPPHTVDALASTQPVPAALVPVQPAATVITHRPPTALEQQLPPARHLDDSPTGSNPQGAGTWSSELNPNMIGADQSWSMGQRTVHDDERPHRSSGGRGWIGWVIGLGVIAVLGGGFGVAWSLGAFDGANQVAGTGSGGDETGEIVTDSKATPPDLPGTDTGASATTTGGADSGAADSGAADSGAADSGAADSGAADSGAADSGAADSGAADSGAADSGGDGGGTTAPKDPPFQPKELTKVGSLYTPKSRGPNGTWSTARDYCRSLARKKRFGLSGWRLAKVDEVLSFRADVDKLLYWSSETDGSKAKVVSTMSGKSEDRDVNDRTPRAFCVSRR